MSPYMDFPNIQEKSYQPIPEGQYPCEFFVIEKTRTKGGDEMWTMQLRFVSGKFEGRIIFDNLVFSEKSKNRVKLIAKRAGIDVGSGRMFEPSDLQGKTVLVSTYVETYEGKEKNRVPFDGYESLTVAPSVTPAKVSDEDDIPF